MARKAKSKFDPKAFFARADGGVSVSDYRKGQVVFTQGDVTDAIYYIQEGKVKITVVSAQGKEAVVAFLESGDFIGEGSLTRRPRMTAISRACVRYASFPDKPQAACTKPVKGCTVFYFAGGSPVFPQTT